MSKIQNLQQALNQSSGKIPVTKPIQGKPSNDSVKSPITSVKPESITTKVNNSSREGKEHVGAWLNPDFKSSLQLVQIRKRKEGTGKKVFLDDLMAEALNELFRKYDVPTVHHE